MSGNLSTGSDIREICVLKPAYLTLPSRSTHMCNGATNWSVTWQVVHAAVSVWVLEGSLPPHLIRFRTDLVQHLHMCRVSKHVFS